MRDRPVQIVGEGKAGAMAENRNVVDVKHEALSVNMWIEVWGEADILQGFSSAVQSLNFSYVTLLEEKIRLLEENQTAQKVVNDQSNSERPPAPVQSATPPPTVISSLIEPPSSGNIEEVLDLDNSGAFELLEFG